MRGRALDAVILGGGPSQPDAVCRQAGVDRKSLIPIGGQAMILAVLRALSASGDIRCAIVVGLRREQLPDGELPLSTLFVSGGDDLFASAEAGLALAESERVLLCASDIPLVTGEALHDFVQRCDELNADLSYAIVERSVMERRFPHSSRHFRPLRDGAFAGGDVMLVNARAFMAGRKWFGRIFAARKSGLRLAALFGPRLLVAYALRRLTVEATERQISTLLGCRCKAIPSPFAEIGMDVDTPRQLVRLTAEVEQARCPR